MTLNVKADNALARFLIRLKWFFLVKRKVIWHKLRGLPFIKHLTRQSRAVFVIGSGRSGTDILVHCLAHSLDVMLINEGDRLAFENWRLKDLDTVKAVVNTSGAPLVLFKPIVETMRVQEFLKEFHDSRAVFIIRDYRDAINSMSSFFGESHVRAINSWVESGFSRFPLLPEELRNLVIKIWSDDTSIETACGIYWLVYNSSYFFLGLSADDRIRLVSYESLVTTPEKKLREVCGFLGLKFKSGMIAQVYASSINRKPAPKLTSDLQRSCEKMWNSLERITKDA